MRLVGLDDGSRSIGVVRDGQVARLAGIEEFWKDPTSHLRSAGRVRAAARQLEALVQIPAVPRDCKVLCVGLNYVHHVREATMDLPTAPNIFARWSSTLTVDGAMVPVPVGEPQLDWEGELAVVVGRHLHGASVEEARDAILFCAAFNDLTARHHQLAVPQWALGKNVDRSAPMGPALVTMEEAGDPQALPIVTRVNGRVMQSGSTAEMVFSAAEVLSYASQVVTLSPGDVLATGTPEGVGWLRDPRTLLSPGDTVEVEIGPLGVLTNNIVDARTRGSERQETMRAQS